MVHHGVRPKLIKITVSHSAVICFIKYLNMDTIGGGGVIGPPPPIYNEMVPCMGNMILLD